MKTKNFIVFKVIALLLVGSFIAGCGKKNKVSKNDNTNSPFGFNSNNGLPQEVNNSIANAINNVQCDYHGAAQTNNQRIRREFTANAAPAQGSNTTLYATWTQGKRGGSVVNTYIGRTYEGDVIIIYKTQQGYDMDLMLCPARSNTTGTHFIGGDAQLSNFTFSGYNLDTDVNCGQGAIDAGSFSFFTNRAGTVNKLVSKVCWR